MCIHFMISDGTQEINHSIAPLCRAEPLPSALLSQPPVLLYMQRGKES